MRRSLLSTALLLVALSLAAACGSGGGDSTTSRWPQVLELTDRDLTLLPLNHQLVVGDNRFVLGITDRQEQPVLRANVTMRFFKIEGEEGTLKAEMPAKYVFLEQNFVHEHQDGARHTHTGPEVGVYVAQTEFEEPGDWGAEIEGEASGKEFGPLRLRFNVLEQGTVPAIGAPAPRSRQLTLRDVADISQIDSSNPPHPEMHELTIAEALDRGKPVVVAFATPAFCVSRTCGPVLDEAVVPLLEQYRDRVVFVHVEPYDLAQARQTGQLVPVAAMNEWGLTTEPWVFVIDRQGRIAGKFEGITNVEEVEAVLQQVLG